MTPAACRDATTPVGKGQKGKPTVAKYLALIMALHPVAYVATATLSNMEDYAKKLLKAKGKEQRRLCLCPCICSLHNRLQNRHRCGYISLRTAVRTNYFPLWEMENGKFRITAPVPKSSPDSGLR